MRLLPLLFSTVVNVDELSCPVVAEGEDTPTSAPGLDGLFPDDTSLALCGTDGETYQSLCQLLQTSSNVRIAHARACDAPECQTGQVRVHNTTYVANHWWEGLGPGAEVMIVQLQWISDTN